MSTIFCFIDINPEHVNGIDTLPERVEEFNLFRHVLVRCIFLNRFDHLAHDRQRLGTDGSGTTNGLRHPVTLAIRDFTIVNAKRGCFVETTDEHGNQANTLFSSIDLARLGLFLQVQPDHSERDNAYKKVSLALRNNHDWALSHFFGLDIGVNKCPEELMETFEILRMWRDLELKIAALSASETERFKQLMSEKRIQRPLNFPGFSRKEGSYLYYTSNLVDMYGDYGLVWLRNRKIESTIDNLEYHRRCLAMVDKTRKWEKRTERLIAILDPPWP